MRIDEFEFRNKQGQEIEPTKNQLVVYIKSLHKEIKELEKALELACERVKYFKQQQDLEMGVIEFFEHEIDYDVNAIVEDFIKQAKEMLENENIC